MADGLGPALTLEEARRFEAYCKVGAVIDMRDKPVDHPVDFLVLRWTPETTVKDGLNCVFSGNSMRDALAAADKYVGSQYLDDVMKTANGILNSVEQKRWDVYERRGVIGDVYAMDAERRYAVDCNWSPDCGKKAGNLDIKRVRSKVEALRLADDRVGRYYQRSLFGMGEDIVVDDDPFLCVVDDPLDLSEELKLPALAPKKSLPPPLPPRHAQNMHQIGQLWGPYGHVIDGGINTSREGSRERIIVNLPEDQYMTGLIDQVFKESNITSDDYEPTGIEKKGLLRKLHAKARKIAYNPNAFEAEEEIMIGEALRKNEGCCRHMGLVIATVLEAAIKRGILKGKVYYVRHGNHGFAVYENSSGEFDAMDAAQHPKPLNVGLASSTMDTFIDGAVRKVPYREADELKAIMARRSLERSESPEPDGSIQRTIGFGNSSLMDLRGKFDWLLGKRKEKD